MAGTRNNPIDKRFIHFKNYSTFLTEINNELEYVEDKLLYGNIKRSSIVWISDKQLIWTHGKFYPLFDLKGFGDVVLTDDLVLKDDDTLIVALAKLNKRTENIEEKLGDSSFVTLDTEQTISGKKTFGVNTYFSGVLSGEDSQYPLHHALKLGAPEVNHCDFYEYGAVWNFYKYQTGTETLVATINESGIAAGCFVKYGGTSSQFLMADGSVLTNVNADTVDGHHEWSFLRYRDATSTNYGGTLWSQIGIREYDNALPDGFENSSYYNYGEAISFPSPNCRFEIYASHTSSSGSGLLYRTGWGDDKRPWRLFLDDLNYSFLLDGRYVNVDGDTMTGPLTVPRINISASSSSAYLTADGNDIAYMNVGGKTLMSWKYGEMAVRPGAGAAGEVSLGTSAIRWNTLYTNSINVTSTAQVANLNADMIDGLHADNIFRKQSVTWNNNETIQDWAKRIGWGAPTMYTESGWGWAANKNLNVAGYTIGSQYYMAIDIRPGDMNSTWSQKAMLFIPTYNSHSAIYLAQMTVSETAGNVSLSLKRYLDYDTIVNGGVAYATKLQTARSLWGQPFDGTGDVGGNLTIQATNANLQLGNFISWGGTYYPTIKSSAADQWVMFINPHIAHSNMNNKNAAIIRMAQDASASNYWDLLSGNGDGSFIISHGTSNNFKIYDSGAYLVGTLQASGDVIALSDRRVKSNIKSLYNRGYLIPRTYIKDNVESIGFIAQEVQEKYPELVKEGSDSLLALNYGGITAVLAAQIIEQQEEISELKQEVALLKSIIYGK